MLKIEGFITSKIVEFIVATFLSVLGYFSPLKNIAHLVLFFFFIDIIYGYMADRKTNRAKFKPSIIWKKTMPRVVLTFTLLICAFLLDKVSGQDFISTYNVLGWFVCSLLFISIAKNGYIITKWEAIPFIGQFISKKIKD